MDLAKAKKWQMAIIGYRYVTTTRAYANKSSAEKSHNFFPSVEKDPSRNSTGRFHRPILHQFAYCLRGSSSCEDIMKHPIALADGMASVCISVYLSCIPAHRKLKWCRKAACWVF
jgi:hypothetical protein